MTSQRSNARESLFRNLPKLLRDARFLRVAGQVLAVLVFVLVVILIWDNLTYNLRQLGIRLGFDFLKSQASFDIGEPHSLQSSQQLCSSHVRGLLNSLRVIVLGLILTTILGVIAGIARLSITG